MSSRWQTLILMAAQSSNLIQILNPNASVFLKPNEENKHRFEMFQWSYLPERMLADALNTKPQLWKIHAHFYAIMFNSGKWKPPEAITSHTLSIFTQMETVALNTIYWLRHSKNASDVIGQTSGRSSITDASVLFDTKKPLLPCEKKVFTMDKI